VPFESVWNPAKFQDEESDGIIGLIFIKMNSALKKKAML